MSQVDDLTSRLSPGGVDNSLAGGSISGAMWGIIVLGVIVVMILGIAWYRDWRIQQAFKARPKREPVPFCGTTRVAGMTLAEVRRLKELSKKSDLEVKATHKS